MQKTHCPILHLRLAIQNTLERKLEKPNCIWLETSGCFGEIISLLDGEDPGLLYFLKEMCNVTYFGSIMGDEGETAYERILETLEDTRPLIFIVCGAIPTASDGVYTILFNYKGKSITALDCINLIAPKSTYILAVGTCACFGGPTAAKPNVSNALPVNQITNLPVINIPGCPANPVWTLGTLAYLLNFGMPSLDEKGRPTTFFSDTIHQHCPRRSYFDKGIFAKNFGDPECMFQLGCRGPITSTLCPLNRWNQGDNWPIGASTTCIGCANQGFPDLMEPFFTIPSK